LYGILHPADTSSTLPPPGEVKDDLADFNNKLRENDLLIYFFLQKHLQKLLANLFELHIYRTSKNDVHIE
jgi:hypothetical protein